MDLESYGIHKTLKDQASLTIREEDIDTATYVDDIFSFSDGDYRVERKLGEGSYGKIYEVMSVETGDLFAVKVQKYESASVFQETVLEAIMNIILMTVSESKPNGPYVQRIYEIAYDPLRRQIYMRIEMLDGTLGDLLLENTIEENDTALPKILLQIGTILDFFHTAVGMNHRDLKSDNIMYSMKNGKPRIKLIDLGLACMTYKNIHFATSTIFPSTHACNRKSRDLSFLVLELLLDFADRMNSPLYETLRESVRFNIRGTECRLNRYCPHEGFRQWLNSYEFLNRADVENPRTSPKELRKRMLGFLEKLKTAKNKPRRFTVRRPRNVFRGFLPS
jgi:serine/threonine protein kinase